MNQQDFNKLIQIRKLLKEAYDHYFTNDLDGSHKSQEGHIGIEFGNYWEDKKCEMKVISISIYSYVFGHTRTHCYYSIDEALEVIKEWHKNEMSTDYAEQRRLEKEYDERYPQGYLINPDIKLEKDYWGGPKIE